jgi:hypothetical protein
MGKHSNEIELVRGTLEGVRSLAVGECAISGVIDDANRSARSQSEQRLSVILPRSSVRELSDYFVSTIHHGVDASSQSGTDWPLEAVLEELCSLPRSVALGVKSTELQVCILNCAEPLEKFGEQTEPGSNLLFLDPSALKRAADGNASIEIRVFDRHSTAWTRFVDDLAAVSGADIYMKLFIAGGNASVNGWHRDKSDVLVTMLNGFKRFEVATAESKDASPNCEVDVSLAPGEVLLMPRSRLHNATPVHGISTLLSVGIMRHADWVYRGLQPTHLGLNQVPTPEIYRLALKAHSPRGKTVHRKSDAKLISRLPGGMGLLERHGPSCLVAMAGKVWRISALNLDLLCRIHSREGTTVQELTQFTGRDVSSCDHISNALIEAGVVAELQPSVS